MRGALIVLASVALAGCRGERAPGKAPADDAAPVVTGPPSRIIDPTPLPAAPRPQLPRRMSEQLLDAGKGARRALRYRFEPTSRTTVASASIQSQGFDGAPTELVTLAPVREGFEATPRGDGGLVAVRGLVAEIERAGQSESSIAAAEAYLARWRSLVERRRADVVVDERGGLGEITFQAGAGDRDARDELAQRWLGLVVPLPEAPVAVGARWKVVTMLRSGGAAVTQSATYTLVAIDRGRWTIAVEQTRQGRMQDISMPGLPEGATAQLVALIRKVTGTVIVSPSSPLPLSGELKAEVRSHARFTVPGAPPRDQYSEDTATITIAEPPPAPAP